MVHPNVPAIILCPICPHSLSFRPIIVPAGVEIKVSIEIILYNIRVLSGLRGLCDLNRMVLGFMTTYAVSAYDH
jgi:hypothetical protein